MTNRDWNSEEREQTPAEEYDQVDSIAERSLRKGSAPVVARRSTRRSFRSRRRQEDATNALKWVVIVGVVITGVAALTRGGWVGDANATSLVGSRGSRDLSRRSNSVASEMGGNPNQATPVSFQSSEPAKGKALTSAIRGDTTEFVVERISKANSLSAVANYLQNVSKSVSPSQHRRICDAALEASRSLLDTADRPKSRADSFSLLADLEEVSGASVCNSESGWAELARELEIELPRLQALDEGVPADRVVETWKAWTAHAGLAHDCLMDEEVQAWKLAVLEHQRSLFDDTDELTFLRWIRIYEEAGLGLAPELVTTLIARLESLEASGSWEQSERHFEHLTNYVSHEIELPAKPEGRAAKERVLMELLALTIDKEGAPKADELFERLARLESLLVRTDSAELQALSVIPREVAERFQGREPSMDLIEASFEFLTHRESSLFDELASKIAQSAQTELQARLKGQKEDLLVQIVDRLAAIQAAPGPHDNDLADFEAFRSIRESVLAEIEGDLKMAREKRALRTQAGYDKATKVLEPWAKALRNSSHFREERLSILEVLTTACHEHALAVNRNWLTGKKNKRPPSTTEFNDAEEWAKEWLGVAETSESKGESLTLLIKTFVDRADHYRELCDRFHDPRVPRWTPNRERRDADDWAPQKELQEALEFLDRARTRMREHQALGVNDVEVAVSAIKAERVHEALQDMVAPSERFQWPGDVSYRNRRRK